MADNQKKDFDFFSDEVENSIDSLFTAKRTIEIDPLTNQIKEIEQYPFAQTVVSSVEDKTVPLKEEIKTTPPETISTSQDIKDFLKELKQAVLTFEWEITEKNIQSVKKYVDDLESKVILDNIVAKSIYTLIQDNLELMLSNTYKIPAKGPVAIQKGLDIIALYIERGDDAILQAGDSVSSTLTLLEEIKSSFKKFVKPFSPASVLVPATEIVAEPEKEQLINESELSKPVLEVSEETKAEETFDFEIGALEEEQEGEQAASEVTETPSFLKEEVLSETAQTSQGIQNEIDSFEMALDESLSSSFPGKILVDEPKESEVILKLEPIVEEIQEKFTEIPKKQEQTVTLEQQKAPLSKPEPSLNLVMEEEHKESAPPKIEENKTTSQPVLIKEEIFQPIEKKAPEKPSLDYDAIFGAQIEHLENYIEKLKNLESVCCDIPSLNKLCLFAQSLKNEIENDKLMLSKYLSGDTSQMRKILAKPQISHDSFRAQPQKILHEGPQVIKSEEPPKKPVTPPVIEEFKYTEIYVTVWGKEKVGFIPDEIAFDGNLPIWYRQKAIRMTNIPLKFLKQWPWSKVTPVLRGYITTLAESNLSAMFLPLKKASNHPLGISQNPNILILYKDDKGCVLFTTSTLQIKSTRDYQWIPAEEDDFIGYIQKDDEKIKIFSVKRGS